LLNVSALLAIRRLLNACGWSYMPYGVDRNNFTFTFISTKQVEPLGDT
jgi:hypothetical protein